MTDASEAVATPVDEQGALSREAIARVDVSPPAR